PACELFRAAPATPGAATRSVAGSSRADPLPIDAWVDIRSCSWKEVPGQRRSSRGTGAAFRLHAIVEVIRSKYLETQTGSDIAQSGILVVEFLGDAGLDSRNGPGAGDRSKRRAPMSASLGGNSIIPPP